MATLSAELERRALTLFEQLTERPGDAVFRQRLIAGEPAPVRDRVAALEASIARAAGAIPTLIPGSADCDGALPPPQRVGRFRLIRPVGRGGMGEVWLGGRDDGLFAQRVAVKLIQRHALARAAAAFDDERRFLARLEHPGIARLIDGGVTEDGLPWLATEYVEGVPIDAASAGRPLRERVRLLLDACEAVQFVHGRLVAHGDIKPSNILVSDDGRVKLLDFGIARLLDADAPASPSPFTPDFASPERTQGHPPSVSDDVFALGRVLAALIADHPDHELMAIADRASANEPERRYPSVTALAVELERWRDGLPVAATGGGTVYRARKFVHRHRRGLLATTAAMVLLGVSGALALRSHYVAERQAALAQQRFDQLRRLSRYLLFAAYDDLARKPGTVEERERLVATATDYMRQLHVTDGAAPALRLETAQSYRRLAAVQGLSSAPGEDDRARALAASQRLLESVLAQSPADVPALVELAAVHADLWALRGEGDADHLDRAEALLDRALRLAPASQPALLQRLRVNRDRGVDLIFGRDRPAEALPLLRRSVERLGRMEWDPALRSEAIALAASLLNRVGDATYYAGDVAGSLRPYRTSEALVKADMVRDGATPQRLALQADNAFDISGVLAELPGRLPEALAAAQAPQPALRQALASGPDAVIEKKLLVLWGQEAAVLGEMGRTGAAMAISRRSVALRQARLHRAPGDYARTRDLAIGLTAHAAIATTGRRKEEACRAAADAVAIWRGLEVRGRLETLDARRGLPQSETARKAACPVG
jgi:eukaryotic-like serine/threonine-protein kinase